MKWYIKLQQPDMKWYIKWQQPTVKRCFEYGYWRQAQ